MADTNSSSSVRRSGTVAIVGRPNVGKSTFLNAALHEQLAIVTPTPQTTRDRILGVVRHGEAQIGLIDTPGIHRPKTRLGRHMNEQAREAARGADVVVFMTAIAPEKRQTSSPHPGDVVLLNDIGKESPTVLVINKIDQMHGREALLPLIEQYAKLRDFAAVVPISARKANGTERVLDEVAKLLPVRDAVYEEDFLTDMPMRFFAAEYVREQVILATRQEVPHHVAVTISRFDESSGRVTHVEANIHCARDGQRAILIGTNGERLKRIGIAARKRLEALLERQVNLKLWVSVEPNWTDSSQALGSLGYGKSSSDDEVLPK